MSLKRGEIRLCRFAPPDKRRPAVVLTRDSAIGFLNAITVAPITSTRREIPSEVMLGTEDGLKQPCAVSLDHVVTLRRADVGALVGTLSGPRVEQICGALGFALGCRGQAS